MDYSNVDILIKKRRSLNTLIGEWIGRNKSPIDIKGKVQEYSDVVDKLNSLGKQASINSRHLIPSYWDDHTVDDYKKDKENGALLIHSHPQNNVKIVEKVIEKVVEKVKYIKEYNYYILSIAWDKTKTNNYRLSDVDELITPYLSHMGAKKLSEDFNDLWGRTECIIKYKIEGSPDTINAIKNSIEYIADSNKIKLEIFYKINKDK